MTDEQRNLPGWVLPTVGAIVVVGLVVIGLTKGTPALDPSTPEGTVQRYLEAVFAGDDEAAAAYTDKACGSGVDYGASTEGVSASLVSSTVDGNEATVTVRLSQASGDPLSGLYEWTELFTLIEEGGSWEIQQPAWPYYC